MSPLQLWLANLTHVGVALASVVGVALLLHLLERAVGRYVSHRLGWRAVLVTGWLGVPVHEFGHLLTAWAFGHRIVAFRLFDPDPATGTLGYVRHAPSRSSVWQTLGSFFIAVAPLLSGALVLGGLLWWMLPPGGLAQLVRHGARLGEATSGAELGQELVAWAGLLGVTLWRGRDPLLIVQVYLCIAVACHIAPSRADLVSGTPGGLLLLLTLVAAAAGAAVAGRSLASVTTLVPLAASLLAGATIFQLAYVALVALLTGSQRRGAATMTTTTGNR